MKNYFLLVLLSFALSCTAQKKTTLSPSGPAKKVVSLKANHSLALKNYFQGQKSLLSLGVIKGKSPDIEIAQYLANRLFSSKPNRKVLFHNGKGIEITFNKPISFSELVVVLGPDSSLRQKGSGEDFLLFRYTQDQVRVRFSMENSKFSCGKSCFHKIPHGRIPFKTAH
jgi:hypothetical protein